MLTRLTIQNFALIDNVELDFKKGLTVITGETGSGKSILLGSLHLLLGERADYSIIRNQESKTIVEGSWDIKAYNLKTYFDENELDYEAICIVRREILPQGKSRAFINDSPVSLNVLKDLMSQLIQINSQHQTLALKDKLFQSSLVDYLGGHIHLLNDYQFEYDQFISIAKKYNTQKENLAKTIQERDYRQFQLEEINVLQLEKNNYDELIAELEKSEHAEEIIAVLGQTTVYFEDEQFGFAQLKRATNQLGKIANVSTEISEIENRLKSQIIELDDIHQELIQIIDSVDVSPEKVVLLTSKVDDFKRVLKKHNLDSQEELTNLKKEFEASLNVSQSLEEEVLQLEKSKDLAWKKVLQLSKNLSETRKKSIPLIIGEMKPVLAELKLPDVQIDFKLTTKESPDRRGAESVDLLFSPNRGIAPQQIEKSASGGELGRFMLVIQSLLGDKKQLPTIIFDEIDTGVSGDVAARVGKMLRKMGNARQTFAITHLPQVAAAGNWHLKVLKSADATKTTTHVQALNEEQRKLEVAQLMSGQEINEAAIENARILMETQND